MSGTITLSKELQQGKAAEHLVCCDLIMQGFNVFLADQGLYFDLVAEHNGKLYKIQVRSTNKVKSWEKAKFVYRFGTRRGKGGNGPRMRRADCDFYALVAMDIRKVAYFPISEIVNKNGFVKQTIDLRTKDQKYPPRIYPNGTIAITFRGSYIEDHGILTVK